MKQIQPLFDVVIVWYQNDWGLYGRRNEQIARTLLGHKAVRSVLHIEPPLDLESLRTTLHEESMDENVSTNLGRINLRNDKGVFLFTPHVVKNMPESEIGEWLAGQVKRAVDACDMNNILLWLYPPHPFAEFTLNALKDRIRLIVSDCVDDHTQYARTEADRLLISKRYQRLVGSSDIVFCVSKAMRDQMALYNPRSFFIPNAIPRTVLSKVPGSSVPEDMVHVPHPIIGYAGALSMRIDADLLGHVAKTRPEWHIILVGTSPSREVQALSALPNIHWLGPKPYADIHNYLSQFDVCILPHTSNSMTDNMNPLKVYEYLAIGKPVVSTNVAGIGMFRADIAIAADKDEFVRAIERELADDSVQRQRRRIDRVRNHTWMDRVDEMMGLALGAIEGNSPSDERYFSFDRPEVRACVPETAKTVLDVGCGAGRLGAALKEDRDCFVIGVEQDREMANRARFALDDVIVGDIEEKVDKLPGDYFDCIVVADVLEHLKDPEAVLRKLGYALREDGAIVASIPNVRHWPVIKGLLEGKWDYADAGILDKTHLRFFTRKSIVELFHKTGLAIRELRATTLNGEGVPKATLDALAHTEIDISTLGEEGTHYQYLVKAGLGTMAKRLVSIIILTFNQLKHTKLCLKSIKEHTQQPHELIIVDNGSTDGTMDYLREYVGNHTNTRVVSNAENLGFAAGNNQGLAVAKGDYLLLLNNDTIVTEGWLTRLLSVFDRYPEAGIVGPVSSNISGPQLVTDASYQTLEQMHRFARKWSAEHRGQTTELLRVVGFCLLAKREVVERIGGLYEEYGSGNFEDDDFCLRARAAGYKALIARDSFVHHTGSQTFRGAGIDYRQSLERNWEIFKKRWKLPEYLPYGSYSVDLSRVELSQYHVPIPHSSTVNSLIVITSPTKETQDVVATVTPASSGNSIIPNNEASLSRPMSRSVTQGMTSIVILLDNQPQHVAECVASIKRHTSGSFEILFALAPGWEKARKISKALKGANRKHGCANFEDKNSLLRSINLAIEASSGEFIVILDSNVMVTENWLNGMLDCLRSVPDAGLIGPTTNSGPAPQVVDTPVLHSSSEWDGFAKAFRHRNLYRRTTVMKVGKFCLLFGRGLIDSIGVFDSSLEDTSLWDVDFCLRAFLSGYHSVIAADVIVRNFSNLTGDRNSNIFAAKWSSIAPGSDTGRRLIALKAVEYAQGFFNNDKTEEAVKALMEGIKATPDDIRLYHYLARILLGAKMPGEALEALHSIPEKDEPHTQTLELLTYASAALGQDEEADRIADGLLSRMTRNATALNVKGLITFKKGDLDQAVAFFRKSVECDPGYGEPYRNLGLIEWSLGNRTTACDLLEKAFILNPESENNATAYYTAVTEMEAWVRSEQVFFEARDLYPGNRRIAFLLIDILLKQEKLESAMNRIEEALTNFSVEDALLAAALDVRKKLCPVTIPVKARTGTVSVCMITKNEEAHIAKCLQCLKPLADEIIIMDTGSSDRTKDIATVFGAQVFEYAWTEDFSAARNASLEKAKGDWILVHDADEVISTLDVEGLRAITRKKPLEPVAYSFVTRNYATSVSLEGWTANVGDYPEEVCAGWFPSSKVRLFTNDLRFRFRNPVHELLEPSLLENGVEIKACRIPIHHYGRLDALKTNAKAEIYYELGKTKLETAGDGRAALLELAAQANELGKDEEAIDLWRRYLTLDPNLPRAYASLSHCYLKRDDFENALCAARRAFELDPRSKDTALQYATASLFCSQSGHAIPLMEDLLNRAPNHPYAMITLAVAHILSGEQSQGKDLLIKTKKINLDGSQLLFTIAKKLEAAGIADGASRILASATEVGYSHPDWPELLEKHRNKAAQPSARNREVDCASS